MKNFKITYIKQGGKIFSKFLEAESKVEVKQLFESNRPEVIIGIYQINEVGAIIG